MVVMVQMVVVIMGMMEVMMVEELTLSLIKVKQ